MSTAKRFGLNARRLDIASSLIHGPGDRADSLVYQRTTSSLEQPGQSLACVAYNIDGAQVSEQMPEYLTH